MRRFAAHGECWSEFLADMRPSSSICETTVAAEWSVHHASYLFAEKARLDDMYSRTGMRKRNLDVAVHDAGQIHRQPVCAHFRSRRFRRWSICKTSSGI